MRREAAWNESRVKQCCMGPQGPGDHYAAAVDDNNNNGDAVSYPNALHMHYYTSGWIDANFLFGLAQRLGRLEVRAELPSPQREAMASDMDHEPRRILSDPSVCCHHPRSPSFETELLR